MSLALVRLVDRPPLPWRNGGGRTRELLAWPDANRWSLRLSLAAIERDGPFSAYPGVERWFAVVAGAGVELAFDGRRERCLTGGPPLRFDGVAAPRAELLDGPTEDLNLMLAAGSSGRMLLAVPGRPAPPARTLRALYTADAVTLHCDGAPARSLEPGTLAWATGAQASEAAWSLQGAPGLRAWWIVHAAPAP